MYLPKQQAMIRRRCVHASGRFREFDRAEIEQSIAARFEAQVVEYPNRAADIQNGYLSDSFSRGDQASCRMTRTRSVARCS